MKKLLLISFIFASNVCNAGNLEFNQVIVLDASLLFTQTVPVGKVWEIKSASVTSTNQVTIFINSGAVMLVNGSLNMLPFWVPEGTVLASPGGLATTRYCIIEYNVIP